MKKRASIVRWTCVACGKKQLRRNLNLLAYELEGFVKARETKVKLRYCANNPTCERIANSIATKRELLSYLTPGLRARVSMAKHGDALCGVKGCGKPCYSKNHCKKHTTQINRYGQIYYQEDYNKRAPRLTNRLWLK